jgi:hypothetical protein
VRLFFILRGLFMGLGKFFSKSKAKSIEVNGVKYLAPKDGVCSIKVEEGKVFVNGEEATKEIIEKSPEPKTSSKDGIHFDELKVVFNGVENTKDNTIDTDLEKIDIEVNNYKFEDVMDLDIISRGDVEIFGNVNGTINTEETLTIHGNVTLDKTDIIKGSGIYVDGNLIQILDINKNCQNQNGVFLEGNSLDVTKDLIANVKYDSGEADSIHVGGNFIGKISDTAPTINDWADITIEGKAIGEIHTTTQGEIRIGKEED